MEPAERREPVEPVDLAELEWPWWLPWVTVGLALASSVTALVQRASAGHPRLWFPALMFGLGVLPFFVDVVCGHRDFPLVRREIWAIPTIVAMAVVLIDTQTSSDAAGYLFIVLGLQAGATAPLRSGLVVLVAMAALTAGLEVADQIEAAAIWIFGMVAAFAGGQAFQKSLLLLAESEARQVDVAERATADERRRIAREVHDVVAHSLSVTLLHLTGARRALETDGDVEEAVRALRDAEQLGRDAMAEIRRTVGLVDPDSLGATEPLPAVTDFPELVESFRSAGVKVDCTIHGDPAPLSGALGLNLYRIAQESLANVAKHAPGAAVRLVLDLTGDPVRLTVRNGPADGGGRAGPDGDGSGRGIPGMTQRAVLLGGRMRAEADDDGWIVEATVPREPAQP